MFAKLKDGFGWFLSQAFGSDELTAYTAEYTWESNQMAHAMMGFALAVVWLRLAISRWERHQWRLENPDADGRAPGWCGRQWQAGKCGLKKVPVLGPALAWAWHSLDFSTAVLFALIPLKEVADILLDNATFAGSPVQPNRWPLYFDSITDISFWWTGMFLAAAVVGGFGSARLNGWRRFLLGLGGLIACVAFWYLYAAPIWGDQKRTFDQSGLPFNYTRLAVLAADDKKWQDRLARGETEDELRKKGKSRLLADYGQWEGVLKGFRERTAGPTTPAAEHYVVLGGTPEQRTRLAVAMGCEFALALRGRSEAWATEYRTATEDDERRKDLLTRVKYVTAVAGLERPQVLLPLRYVECLVIDDVNVFIPPPFEADHSDIRAAKAAARPTGKAADANQGPPLEPSIDSVRRGHYKLLGEKAKENDIGTIWVLTGSRNVSEWEQRKEDWLDAIARTVKVDKAKLQLIVLAEPR